MRARRLATEGLALCRRRNFPELEGRMLLQLGVASHAAGDPDLAHSYLDEAVALTAEAAPGPGLGSRCWSPVLTPGNAASWTDPAQQLVRTLLALGEVDDAAPIIDEGFDLAHQVGDLEVLAGFDELSAARGTLNAAGQVWSSRRATGRAERLARWAGEAWRQHRPRTCPGPVAPPCTAP